MINECIFCSRKTEIRGGELCEVDCPNCGKYQITREAMDDLPHELTRKFKDTSHLMSGYLRELNERKLSPEVITYTNYGELLKSPIIPKNFMRKVNKLLLYFGRQTSYFGEAIDLPDCPAVAYAVNGQELTNCLFYLINCGMLKGEPDAMFSVTMDGFSVIETLDSENKENKKAFVAMWFADDMMNIYNTHLSRAIQDAGYESLIISDREHNNNICDEIIAECFLQELFPKSCK